jgi:hypothetical protein
VNPVVAAVAVALAVGAVAQIGSASKISSPLRLWVAQRKTPFWRWVSDLLVCPFCSGVWLSAAGTAIVRPWLVTGFVLIQFGVTWLAVSALAMLPVLWIRKAVKP